MRRLLLLTPLLLGARDAPAPEPMARAILTVQQGATRGADGIWNGGSYAQVESFEVPAGHGPRDNLIAFEGPGWESDRVAYRLYLDERNVPDIYGKKRPGPILHRIGQGKDDYHAMADWGQDILQVDQSLGAGGIGVLRGGKVTQLGPSKINVVITNAPGLATVRVENRGFPGDGGPADLVTTYSIAPGSRLTWVHASATGAVPDMTAGMIRHDGVTDLSGGRDDWHYLATWGDQSLARDGLGMALFFSLDDVNADGGWPGSNNLVLGFCDPARIRYAFAAAWVQEPGAPKTLDQFRAWLDATIDELERTRPHDPTAPCAAKPEN